MCSLEHSYFKVNLYFKKVSDKLFVTRFLFVEKLMLFIFPAVDVCYEVD